MELHLNIIGFLLLVLATIHGVFPKRFDWANELSSVSLMNRQMMYVHTFFIALMVLLMGLLCLTSAQEMIETKLGNKLALGLGIFWTIRLGTQFFGYSSELWKGRKLETTVHILFSVLWTYFSVVFFVVYWSGKKL